MDFDNEMDRLSQQLPATSKYHLLIPVVLAGLSQIYYLSRVFLQNRPFAIGPDAALFEYVGLMSTQGYIPYRDIWDIKPPLIHEVAIVLGHLSGGDPLVLHVLSTLLMAVVFIVIVGLASTTAADLTNSKLAGLGTGLFILSFPQLVSFPARGLRPKLFVMLFGLLAIQYHNQDDATKAGACAAAAAGFWQVAIVFPLWILSNNALHRQKRALQSNVVGILAVTALGVLPFVYFGAFQQLIAQVVFAPFITVSSEPLVSRILRGGYLLLPVAPLVALGVLGSLTTLNDASDQWLPASVLWFGLVILFADFDAAPDLFVAYLFVAIGFGVFIAKVSLRDVHGTVAVIVVVAAGVMMLYWTGLTDFGVSGYAADSIQSAFWNIHEPQCHMRLSGKELEYVEAVGGSVDSTHCGDHDLRTLLKAL